MAINTLLLREQKQLNILYEFILPWVYPSNACDDNSDLLSYLYSCLDSELTAKGEMLWNEYDALSELLRIVTQTLYAGNCTEDYEFLDSLKNCLDSQLTAISNEFDLAYDED